MNKLSFFIIALTIPVLLISCKGNNSSSNNNESTTNKNEIIVDESEKTEDLTEVEVIDFVNTWKNLYATHTFDNYIKLYDRNNFIGIKRTYDKKKNVYDYSGWYDNKINEFRKFEPEITVDDIKVKFLNIEGKSKVSFIQTWISYKTQYADTGEKVLILKKINGEIFIEKEELLYSQPAYDFFGT